MVCGAAAAAKEENKVTEMDDDSSRAVINYCTRVPSRPGQTGIHMNGVDVCCLMIFDRRR